MSEEQKTTSTKEPANKPFWARYPKIFCNFNCWTAWLYPLFNQLSLRDTLTLSQLSTLLLLVRSLLMLMLQPQPPDINLSVLWFDLWPKALCFRCGEKKRGVCLDISSSKWTTRGTTLSRIIISNTDVSPFAQ